MKNYKTQMEAARKGIITKEMETVAKNEYNVCRKNNQHDFRGQKS